MAQEPFTQKIILHRLFNVNRISDWFINDGDCCDLFHARPTEQREKQNYVVELRSCGHTAYII